MSEDDSFGVFKILNNLSPAYLNDLLTFKTHSYNFRYQRTDEVPQVRLYCSAAAKSGIVFRNISVISAVIGVFKNQINARSGGPVNVYSVLLVEMFYL